MAHQLEVVDLTCARGDRPLFRGLSCAIGAGELLHIAGSNGSGKTTLLRTVSGLSRPADGDVRWQGDPIYALGDEYRRDVAYIGHLDGNQGELTPVENLRAYRCMAGASLPLHRLTREDDALERLGLGAYRSFPSKILSQGQKRRLALARLLVAAKPLWILDEPFTALDVQSCHLINELLMEHLGTGGMAILSSHQSFEMREATPLRIDLDGLRPDDIFVSEATAESVTGGAPA